MKVQTKIPVTQLRLGNTFYCQNETSFLEKWNTKRKDNARGKDKISNLTLSIK